MSLSANTVLLIVTRRIGDVLLSTPLLRSLRRACPQARIDALVFKGTGGILAGNPDVNHVLEVEPQTTTRSQLAMIARVFRRYDLALTTQGGDRPFLYTLAAAHQRLGIVPALRWQDGWKRWLTQRWTLLDDLNTHTVLQNLRLADLLAIPRCYQVVPPRCPDFSEVLRKFYPMAWSDEPYVVLHPVPMWRYKHWTRAGWIALAQYALKQGLGVIFSGGPHHQERNFVQQLMRRLPKQRVIDVCGQLNLAQLTEILRRCRCYVGPDTVVTHLAAACGAPTIALFGPTNPIKWGPWPHGWAYDRSPYMAQGEVQRCRNVLLLQGTLDCVPCRAEGCEHHRNSYSRCLDELPAQRVINGLESMLASITSSNKQEVLA